MPWQVEFDEQRRVILLAYRANVSYEDVHESSIAVIAMTHDKDTHKILTDFTDAVSLAHSSIDIFHLPTTYKTLGQDLPLVEAIVDPKDPKIRKDAEFYETVCINRGFTVRVFEDRDQALEWLT